MKTRRAMACFPTFPYQYYLQIVDNNFEIIRN